MSTLIAKLGILALGAASLSANASTARIAVVIGSNAPELERFAASELCHYLDKLFEVKVTPTTAIEPNVTAIFLIGNSTSNPLIKNLPKLSDQGIFIDRVSGASQPTLIVGGGSSRATLWAVYELAERWGVRYLISRDALPPHTRFTMPNFHVVMEPIFDVRAHGTTNVDFADSGEGWGINDWRKLIDQLAKMKYNRINVGGYTWQPYLKYQVDGITRKTVALWYGYHYPITPDMPARSVFPADAKEFWNPDLPVNGTPEELLDAGVKLQHELIAYSQSRGMECVTSANVSEYPKEFAPILGGSIPIRMINKLTTTPGPTTELDDPGLHKLAATVVRTTIDTYPEIDRVNIGINEWRQWTGQYQKAWDVLDKKYDIGKITSLDKILDESRHRAGYAWGSGYDKAALEEKASDEVKGDLASLYFFDWLVKDSGAVVNSKRPDMKFLFWGFAEELYPILPRVLPPHSELEVMPDNFLDHLLQRPEILTSLTGGQIQPIINLTLDDDNIGILSQNTTSALQKLLPILQNSGWKGFVARERFPGDHDTEQAYLSRAAWDPHADPDKIALEQLQAECGERCGEALLNTMHSVDEATHIWESDDEHFAFPVPALVMKYWKPGPVPEYLTKNRKNYEDAHQMAQKAMASATPSGRDYAQFWMKRTEFAVKYIDAIELVHLAATAEAAHQPEAAIEDTTKALAELRQALDAYAVVANSQSDRGAIAVAVEYGYRPLEKKLSELRLQVSTPPAGKH